MKWLHNLLKGFSLTGALFVFQACYGTPCVPPYQDGEYTPMSFSVVSHKTGEPLKGIKILSYPAPNYYFKEQVGVTGEDGRCRVDLYYLRDIERAFITFEDPQVKYEAKDTSLVDLRDREIVIKLEPVQ